MIESHLIFNQEFIQKNLKSFNSPERITFEDDSFVKSAIIILIIIHKNKPYDLVLIRRTLRSGDKHSGEISFPGGKYDHNLDTFLQDTALREIEEELGIKKERILLLGCLDDHITPKKFIITPFIGCIHKNQTIVKQDEEVQEVLKIPISFFVNKKNYKERCYTLKKDLIAVGKYKYSAPNNSLNVIFGATSHIIVSFIETVYQITLKNPHARRLTPSDFK